MITYADIAELSKDIQFELPRMPKHVAVLMWGSNIVEIFTNKYAWHAEEVAISYYLSHNVKMKRLKLYITRMSCHNKMSRPCKHCCLMLRKFPNIRVFYTNEQGDWQEEEYYDADHVSSRRVKLGYCR